MFFKTLLIISVFLILQIHCNDNARIPNLGGTVLEVDSLEEADKAQLQQQVGNS
jgi:hypothetical protein